MALVLGLHVAVASFHLFAPATRPVAARAPPPAATATITPPYNDRKLEALFYAFDADNSGLIDKGELYAALSSLDVVISQRRVDELFAECDIDGNGEIDIDEFKMLVAKAGVSPSSSMQYAMDLFKRYDYDNSGKIDKFEFKEIAMEIEADQRRRSLISGAALAAGAFVVAKFSDEYQWAQRNFRDFYLEPKAEAAQKKAFPTALLSDDFDKAVAQTLYSRGYTPDNTLFAHSICSDEVNAHSEQLNDLMMARWGEGFSLGGLGGLPFAGRSGFRAFLHHVPDSGKLLVLFAPHVGIDADGRIGALQREGQVAVSKACGAGIGSYKAIVAKGNAPPAPSVLNIEDAATDPFDPELGTIISLLEPRIKGIEDAVDPIAYVTYQMYAIVRELVNSCIDGCDDVWDWATEISVVGGIMINRRVGGDFFQPLSFEARRPNGKPTVDLYSQAFGKTPTELSEVMAGSLGSESAFASLYKKK